MRISEKTSTLKSSFSNLIISSQVPRVDSSFFVPMSTALAIGGIFTLFCIVCLLIYQKFKFHQKSRPVSASSTLVSSPPSHSSHPSRIWTHQVFPSFRGEDVRKGLLSHIQKEFKTKGIVPFIDNEIKRGESIGPELFRAIRESKIAIVLLSRNYASSSWCLNELVEIMKCKEELGQTVMTVFYEVDPSDVRKQTGDFGKAFEETCVGKPEEVKQRWRQALMDVANILGEDSRKWDKEADMIVKIAKDVSDVLNHTPSRECDDFVGIQPHITKINSLLSLESGDVKMIGILGPPGIGKTTIARVLYDQVYENFQFAAFIENIRLSYRRPYLLHFEGCLEPSSVDGIINGERQRKINLQRRLLSQVLNQKDIEIRHLGAVEERLKDHKVLLILDGVDQLEQLDAMVKKTQWFGYGSRVVVTTQDKSLLRAHGIDDIYEVELPDKDEAVQIFSLYAFGQKFPYEGFESLACEITELAGELPLGLKVLGSYMRGMSKDEWLNAMPRLRTSLDGELERTLRFSYDVLSDKDKALFLHIACLFEDPPVDVAKRWLATTFPDVNHGFDVLVHKSLIFIEMGREMSGMHPLLLQGVVRMHSLLRQMGREIVRKQSVGEPGKRQFLMDATDVCDVLSERTGTATVQGILFDVSKMDQIFGDRAFEGMCNLQYLLFTQCTRREYLPRGLKYLPPKLRILCWDSCPLKSWPTEFSAKFLVELSLTNGKFEKLWEGILPLRNLKLMDLYGSFHLKEIPDLSTATNLERLVLDYCSNLVKLPSSIRNLNSLKELRMCFCEKLRELPTNISLKSLAVLNLRGCLRLTTFPNISRTIEYLNLTDCMIRKVPSWILSWHCLSKLIMTGCKNLKVFPTVPDSITDLDLSQTEIEEIPLWIGNLPRLCYLNMSGCTKLIKISSNISKNLCLSDRHSKWKWGSNFLHKMSLRSNVDIDDMSAACLPQKASTSTVSFFFYRSDMECMPRSIERIPQTPNLVFYERRKLVSLPQFPRMLTSLDAGNCESLERVSDFFFNPEIRLNFANCINLNQQTKELLQRSTSKHVLLPCGNLPACFTYKSDRGSLRINLNQGRLPILLSFKACILLSNDWYRHDEDDTEDGDGYEYNEEIDDDDERILVRGDHRVVFGDDCYNNEKSIWVICHVRGKQNGDTVRYGSNVHNLSALNTEHLFTFSTSFALKENNNLEREVTHSEIVFKFNTDHNRWRVIGCGIQLLGEPFTS